MATDAAPAVPSLVGKQIDRGWELEESIPTFHQVEKHPESVTEDDASAIAFSIGTIARHADEVEAAAKTWVDEQRARVGKMLDWFGPALLKLAQARIGSKSPRKLLLPFGSLSLRKEPDRLVAKEGEAEEKAFRVWDARQGHKWTRAKVTSDMLTREELDAFVNALPDTLLTKFRWKIEVRKAELNEEFKANGAIPPGFDVAFGGDRLKVDMVTAPKEDAT
jgi:hypothetical protein